MHIACFYLNLKIEGSFLCNLFYTGVHVHTYIYENSKEKNVSCAFVNGNARFQQ